MPSMRQGGAAPPTASAVPAGKKPPASRLRLTPVYESDDDDYRYEARKGRPSVDSSSSDDSPLARPPPSSKRGARPPSKKKKAAPEKLLLADDDLMCDGSDGSAVVFEGPADVVGGAGGAGPSFSPGPAAAPPGRKSGEQQESSSSGGPQGQGHSGSSEFSFGEDCDESEEEASGSASGGGGASEAESAADFEEEDFSDEGGDDNMIPDVGDLLKEEIEDSAFWKQDDRLRAANVDGSFSGADFGTDAESSFSPADNTPARRQHPPGAGGATAFDGSFDDSFAAQYSENGSLLDASDKQKLPHDDARRRKKKISDSLLSESCLESSPPSRKGHQHHTTTTSDPFSHMTRQLMRSGWLAPARERVAEIRAAQKTADWKEREVRKLCVGLMRKFCPLLVQRGPSRKARRDEIRANQVGRCSENWGLDVLGTTGNSQFVGAFPKFCRTK